MKIGLIGGSGFIGSRLTIQLLTASHTCTVFDKKKGMVPTSSFTLGDVRDEPALNAYVPDHDALIVLAAEHTDNVSPTSLYYDVNVGGAKNIVAAAARAGIKRIFFISSVAVYGFHNHEVDESFPPTPVNDYGKSKLEAESVFAAWQSQDPSHQLTVVRPVVVFGEGNRGNVYNLFAQIASGKFLMVGNGKNKKSMAYVGNIAAFIASLIEKQSTGISIFNYADKPDLSMNELVTLTREELSTRWPRLKIPLAVGIGIGAAFDFLSKVSGKKFPISTTRIRKFCLSTQFSAKKAHKIGAPGMIELPSAISRTLAHEFGKAPKKKLMAEPIAALDVQ